MPVSTYAVFVLDAVGITLGVYQLNKKTGIKKIDEVFYSILCGQEIYSNGKISYETSEMICRQIKAMQDKLIEYQVENSQLYITHALFEASNLDFVVTQIKNKTQMKAKVLNNSKEHYLILQSIASKMPQFNTLIQKGTLILDIGYGTLQTTLYDQGELILTQTSKLGVYRLSEMVSQFHGFRKDSDQLIKESIYSSVDEFDRHLFSKYTIENVIIVGQEIVYFNQQRSQHKAFYTVEELKQVNELIKTYDINHQELLSALFVLVNALVEKVNPKKIFTPDARFIDGAVAYYAYKKYKLFSGHHFTNDRLTCAKNLAKTLGCDLNHNIYVLDMATKIFKAVSKSYGLTSKDQQVLELACIMHNCGRLVNKHYTDELSYAIIKASDFINLSDINRLLIANVIRYKNRPFPQASDFYETHITNNFYVILARVTAIFRIAEALDECHLQKFKDLKVTMKENELILRVSASSDTTIEQSSFEESASLFLEVFGIKPVLKIKRGVSYGV